jgi:hypothetical protein
MSFSIFLKYAKMSFSIFLKYAKIDVLIFLKYAYPLDKQFVSKYNRYAKCGR